ncbi:MAG: hypothetical protein AAGE84_02655 [Cyanobacteria bacterium P01_G01_bin.39]
MSSIVNPTTPLVINSLPNGGLDIQGIEDQENRLEGSESRDLITGGDLDDLLNGLGGADTIMGGEGNDGICGDAGDDELFGEGGDDIIEGNLGEDILDGGSGDDRLIIESGGSTLTGGAGSDVFQFDFRSQTEAQASSTEDLSIEELGIVISEITDFQPGEDKLTIQGLGGTEAPIYNSDTGVFSLDGVEIAQLAENLNISEADIEIVGNNNPLSIVDNSEDAVYRFFDPVAGGHFYTSSEVERDNAIENLTNYDFEGAAYTTVDPTTGGQEVYRFFNQSTGVHLYTISEVERDTIIENLPDFQFEGVQFYAYETEVEGSIPIYRFFEPTLGVHFYTPSEVERDNVIENLPNYDFEGIAYYALPVDTEEV